MIRVNVLCEGQTEENFVKGILFDHLIQHEVLVNPINLKGAFNFERVEFNIHTLLKKDSNAVLTTMIDFYGLTSDFPGYSIKNSSPDPVTNVLRLEQELSNAIDAVAPHNGRFFPYLSLHEFEALLFSNPETLEEWLSLDAKFRKGSFGKIRKAFPSPEHINDSPQSAPSKRILKIVPAFKKNLDGPLIAEEIGLNRMRQECAHFDDWIKKLESLSSKS